ncbi:MAG: hypothetical protein AAGF98_06505 [Cyanobacteria bacterium P01_H01_bin.153]
MITLTPDEVTLIKSVLTALRGIKVRDIDRSLLVLNKRDGEQLEKPPFDSSEDT